MELEDFTYNAEEDAYVHEPTGFMLDSDFILLFENEIINNLFKVVTKGEEIPEEILTQLRAKIEENSE